LVAIEEQTQTSCETIQRQISLRTKNSRNLD